MQNPKLIRRIADLIDGEHFVYIYLKSREAIEEFRRRAWNEWIRFGDGAEVRDRKTDPIMRLNNDKTVCYVGYAGIRALRGSNDPKILRVDFERYINGERKYIIPVKRAGK